MQTDAFQELIEAKAQLVFHDSSDEEAVEGMMGAALGGTVANPAAMYREEASSRVGGRRRRKQKPFGTVVVDEREFRSKLPNLLQVPPRRPR